MNQLFSRTLTPVLSTLLIIVSTTNTLQAAEKEKPIIYKVVTSERHQTIDNFGASDAWRIDFIGKYWPVEKRNQIADLLFSTEFDSNGNPIGIGLSNWRVNIGAGSYENRENKEVTSDWNRTECFLQADGTYDFSKQAGQRWFMQAAKERGVDDFLFFTNSAPYFMTRSGSTLAPDRNGINIQDDKFDDFARFLATTAKHFISQGINVRYISPINEPQIHWGENTWQEGSFATNADAFKLVNELDKAISDAKIPTQIVFGEAADLKFLFDCNQQDADMPDNIIEEFFTVDGKYNITKLDNVYNCVTGHDYWSAYPANTLVEIREKIKTTLQQDNNDTKFWASEYCILEKNDEIGGEPSPTKSINLGLYIARIIHNDLAVANASAWQWWTAVSMGEDVAIQLKPKTGCTGGSLKYDGEISPTKMHWATGNYSLFIRPGWWRVSLESTPQTSDLEAATSLMASAYSNGNETVVVYINYSDTSKTVKLECDKKKSGKLYETSETKNLEFCGEQKLTEIVISPRSILTVVI